MEKVKKILIRLFISVIIAIIFIYLIEFIIRIILKNDKTDMLSSNYLDWKEEDLLIFKMNSDKLQMCKIGDQGLCMHKNEVVTKKTEGTKRILVVGDSYVWGDGYSNQNDVWWMQFKELLKQKGYDSVEVYASGVSGLSTRLELEYILKNKELMKKLDPDFIVMTYVLNDPEKYDEDGKPIPLYFNQYDLFYYNSNAISDTFKSMYPNLYYKLCNVISNRLKIFKEFTDIFGYEYYDWVQIITSGKSLREYEYDSLVKVKEYIENELNVPYIFFNTSITQEPAIENVIKLWEKYDIEYALAFEIVNEIEPNFKDIHLNSGYNWYSINPANAHPSIKTANYFAKCLLRYIEKKYSYILGSKNSSYTSAFVINDYMPYSLLPEKIGENEYRFTYPSQNSQHAFLTLPIRKQYIKLNLEDPFSISKITLEGENIEDVDIYLNYINEELGCGDQVMHYIEKGKDELSGIIDNSYLVTSINISAKIAGGAASTMVIKVE